jgi:hypothetical protein
MLNSQLWTLGRFEIGILARYRNQIVQTSNIFFPLFTSCFCTLKELRVEIEWSEVSNEKFCLSPDEIGMSLFFIT